jgi:hypothetical protein
MADATQKTIALLQAWTTAFRQVYAPGINNALRRHGKTTRIIPESKRRVMGNSIEYTVQSYVNRGTRVTMDPMADTPPHTPGDYVKFTPTFDETTAANNHFAVFECFFGTTLYGLLKRGDTNFKEGADFVRRDVDEGLASVKEDFAKYIHLNSNGLLATIDTTAGMKQADSDSFFSATTLTPGSATTVMFRLRPTAIARIADGQRIDIWNATLSLYEARNLRVAYVHPYEESIVLEIVTRTGAAADQTFQNNGTTPLTDLGANNGGNANGLTGASGAYADGDTLEIYLTGSKGAAPHGTLARLYDMTSTYFGVNRVPGGNYVAKNRILIPVRVDPSEGGASVALTADMFRKVGEVVGWQQGGFAETAAMAMVMSRYEFRQISAFVEDEGIKLTPALESEVGRSLNKAFGFDGFILHDPNLGSQMIVVDDFAEPGKIDFINRSQWEQLSPIDGGFQMLPGPISGIWNRNNQQGTGVTYLPGKTYSANGLMLATWVCTWPKGQVRLDKLAVTR